MVLRYLRNANGRPCHDHRDDPPKGASSPRKNQNETMQS